MDLFKIILFLLPAFAYANISISVQVSNDTNKSKVVFDGEDVEIISDEERKSFGITDESLKKAVGNLSGMVPTDVFVKSPTPWDDLYKSYKWNQVQRVLYPTGAKILGIKNVPEIFTSDSIQDKRNPSTDINEGDKFFAKTDIHVNNTVSTTWKKNHVISVSQTISYEIDMLGAGIEGETGFSYSHQWGEDHRESKTLTIGSTSGVTVALKRGETAKTVISTSRGTMDIEVYFNARLKGDVAANYEAKYKDHYFWRYPVEDVMEAGGLSNGINSTQVMQIGFYTKGDIVVTDGRKTLFTEKIVFI